MTLNLDKIAIIAGSGKLPREVLDAAKKKNIKCEVIGLKEDFNKKLFHDIKHYQFQSYQISKIINKLLELNVKNLVLAGKVGRKGIAKLFLDKKGVQLLSNFAKAGLNDNTVLSLIINFLESEGFNIIPPEKIADTVIAKQGCITNTIPNQNHLKDIKKGHNILSEIAKFDIGQALMVHNGLVLGVEAAEGTDNLIKRCGTLENNLGGILIKVCKPNQDKRVDLPSIGINTIKKLHQYKFFGVAVEANNSIILSHNETIELADQLGVFIYAI